MIKIKKVLNSSVVLVEDEEQKDFILFGKGLGYGRKVGDTVERKSADQIYMSVDNPKAKELIHLIDSIPNIYLSLTQDIVAHAEKQLGTKLNSGIYFTLMDHLHFAVERHQKISTSRIVCIGKSRTIIRSSLKLVLMRSTYSIAP